MLQFDLFVTVFYAAVRSASNSIRFCKKQLLSCLLVIYIGRSLEYFSINFNFFKFFSAAFYNNAGTFPSSIALISSRSLPVMDAKFSGDIPLWFILIMIFASPSDSPSFLASSRSSFISSLNASQIFASLLISRYSSSFALTLICENASIFYNPYPSQIISFLTYAAVLKSTTAISVSMVFSLSIIDSIFSIVTPLI